MITLHVVNWSIGVFFCPHLQKLMEFFHLARLFLGCAALAGQLISSGERHNQLQRMFYFTQAHLINLCDDAKVWEFAWILRYITCVWLTTVMRLLIWRKTGFIMEPEAPHRLHLPCRRRDAQLWFCNSARLKELFQYSEDHRKDRVLVSRLLWWEVRCVCIWCMDCSICDDILLNKWSRA